MNDENPQGVALTNGDSLPDFSVTMADGTIIDTGSLRGRTALIIFFNTACQDCRHELPIVQEVMEKFSDDPDVIFIAISRQQDEASVAEYWKENSLSIPYSAQTTKEVYNLFAPSGIPRIFISNPKGIITFSSDDSDMPDAATLEAEIISSLISDF